MAEIEARPRRTASRHQGFKRELASFSNKLAKLIDELREAAANSELDDDRGYQVLDGYADDLVRVHDNMLRKLDW